LILAKVRVINSPVVVDNGIVVVFDGTLFRDEVIVSSHFIVVGQINMYIMFIFYLILGYFYLLNLVQLYYIPLFNEGV